MNAVLLMELAMTHLGQVYETIHSLAKKLALPAQVLATLKPPGKRHAFVS